MEVYEGNDNYLFISYAHKDKETVLPFITELQKYVNVWYDNGINAGNEWSDKIANRLMNCTLFIFLMSNNSLESINCKDELSMMKNYNKPFIIVRIENVEFKGGMELRFGRYQYFDLFSFNSISVSVKKLFNINNTNDDKISLSDFVNSLSNNSTFLDGIKIDSLIQFGKYEGEKILWDVKSIDNDTALLVSNKIIDCLKFNSIPALYQDSDIRIWLNNYFLKNAFTFEELSILKPIAENDYVSLLNKDQIEHYFKEETSRTKLLTEYAKKKNPICNVIGYGFYWLSNCHPIKKEYVYRVYSNGKVGFDDDYMNDKIGVVPIIIIDLKKWSKINYEK